VVDVKPLENVGNLDVSAPPSIFNEPPQPVDRRWIHWSIAAGGAVLVAAAAVVLLRRRKKKAAIPTPPEEIAYEALRRLVALNLVEQGKIELFFVILSAILREYVENRFQVRAPERTTEEFLEEAVRHPALTAYGATLSEFLVLCDRVKFARYEPEAAAIQGAFDVTKQFLSETTTHGT
jgi:LPXTG-motif cell wall-anchored protein